MNDSPMTSRLHAADAPTHHDEQMVSPEAAPVLAAAGVQALTAKVASGWTLSRVLLTLLSFGAFAMVLLARRRRGQ